MGEVNRRYFDNLLADKGLSLRSLAQRMGMSHSQLSLTFSGSRKMQLDEAAAMASIFGEPLTRIIENTGVPVRGNGGRRVSVVGAMRGDGTVEINLPGVVERTSAPEDVPENGIAIQARTVGTPLDWLDGWLFFCASPSVVDPAALGRFSYVQIHDGPAVMATLKRGYREQTFNLSGTFSSQNVTVEWATPVIATRN